MKKLLGLAVFSLLMVAAAGSAQAGNLKGARVSLSTPKAGDTATHTFRFTASTTETIKSIKFLYCTTPSGNCAAPAGLGTMAAGVTLGTYSGLTGTWSLTKTAAGDFYISAADGGVMTQDTTVATIPIAGITNSAIDNCQAGGDNSSDTCYVKISTFVAADTTGTAIDDTIVSYTVVQDVAVTARVDPIFTFLVSGVASGMTFNTIPTSVTTAFNTLPFGNLTANTPKYAAHKLNVTTNTQGGYTVDVLMTKQMTGVYTTNNIDPFIHNWSDPQAWTSPNGTAVNDNTGWLGANTTDGDVSTNWLNAQSNARFGGIILNTPVTVMKGLGSDNGTGAVYVTYAVEANVFQPADAYHGLVVYNALPTY